MRCAPAPRPAFLSRDRQGADALRSCAATRVSEIAGTRQMDAGALREYFAPLEKWLEQQNQGHPVGW